MEAREYDLMRALEDRHWWYRSLRAFVRSRLDGATLVLDVGCGTGGMLSRITGARAVGVDLSPRALAHARRRGLRSVTRGSADRLPFADAVFDAVLALDLLYHREVRDDGAVLAECRRVLRPGGRVLIHAAAYPWLYGAHDRAVHGLRRHTASSLRALARAAGLEVVELTYRNAPALLGAVVSRGLGNLLRGPVRSQRPPASDLRALPSWLNAVMGTVARLENAWLGVASLPAGLSVWCVARRPAAG